MVNYSYSEMTDMHFVYGVANSNAKEARRIFQERYSKRVVQIVEHSQNFHLYLSESGCFKHNTSEERPRSIRILETDQPVLQEIKYLLRKDMGNCKKFFVVFLPSKSCRKFTIIIINSF